jgi:tRNA modification GTPase
VQPLLDRCDLLLRVFDLSSISPAIAPGSALAIAPGSAPTIAPGSAPTIAHGSAPKSASESALARSERPTILVANKMDLAPHQALLSVEETGVVAVVGTSALRGEGIPQLREAVLHHVVAHSEGEAETIHVTQRRQWKALVKAERSLGLAGEELHQGAPPEIVVELVREALTALGEITGESFTEAVLDEVFQSFCVGK